ncbi:membrane protein (macronuclear) [Tetrahymena thermophila SB210]|uniref:Membrane protein n=1 Tax=Tetrahymena thermophila (strain SB210) TaxID=312017 RepID=I7M2F7_TETTS|nr:membrane protein [Tetrahymena thermophila SB210]EAS00301.1 membrane protein [Tetrahymena thermophila SB210]|eukprot:XP_001020546.1 membrane protein [Tetrahymena thermophila SB210]
MRIIENWIKSKRIYYSIGISAIAVSLYGLTYRQISSTWSEPFTWLDRPALARTHFITGPIVLSFGIFQFNQNLRLKYPSIHIWMGRIYSLANIISVISIFTIVFDCAYGLVPTISLLILNILWIISLVIAIYYIVINKCILSHKYWMLRNYALTCSAITLRLLLGIFSPILGLEIAYKIATSNCYVWNIILAELVIRKLKQMQQINQDSPPSVTQVASSDITKDKDNSPQEPANFQEQA